jgi:hypothetical protein
MKTQQQEIKEAIANGRILQTPDNNEKLKYAIGDRVTFRNDCGVLFSGLKIIGYAPSDHALYKYGNRYFLDKDSWWYPNPESSLTSC